MKAYIAAHLIIGTSVWLGASAARWSTYTKASPWQIIKGFMFTVVAWPIALFILINTTDDWHR